jgi:hypothetical protein
VFRAAILVVPGHRSPVLLPHRAMFRVDAVEGKELHLPLNYAAALGGGVLPAPPRGRRIPAPEPPDVVGVRAGRGEEQAHDQDASDGFSCSAAVPSSWLVPVGIERVAVVVHAHLELECLSTIAEGRHEVTRLRMRLERGVDVLPVHLGDAEGDCLLERLGLRERRRGRWRGGRYRTGLRGERQEHECSHLLPSSKWPAVQPLCRNPLPRAVIAPARADRTTESGTKRGEWRGCGAFDLRSGSLRCGAAPWVPGRKYPIGDVA